MKPFRFLPLLVLALACTASTGAFAQDTDTTRYELTLLGSNAVPAASTTGSGLVTVTLIGDTLSVQGTFQELRGYYTGAHIHYGDSNEEGNALYRLTAELNKDHTAGKFPKAKNKFQLTESHIEILRDGMFYINVTTNDNPNGEIRAQIE